MLRRVLALLLLPGTAAAQARALDGGRDDHGYGGFTFQRLVASGEGNARASGFGASFRIHGMPELALDLGLGAYKGHDALGRGRSEVPLQLTALLYPWPRSALQFYLPAGVGYDWASVDLHDGQRVNWRHFGVSGGLGAELYLTAAVSIFVDLRGFVRWRTGGDAGPEFQAADGRSTDASGGAYSTLGLAWYSLGRIKH